MTYKALKIDNKKLTIMNIPFSDAQALQKTANAIGSNMFEGFEPTRELLELYRDFTVGKITSRHLLKSLQSMI